MKSSRSSRHHIFLSHSLGCDTPMYANQGSPERERLRRIDNGDSVNSERWSINNHTGTHIDFPRHFFEQGDSLSEFPADFFVAQKTSWIDLSKICRPGLIFGPSHFDALEIPADTEALLLKTGFESYRGQPAYWQENPGYAEELAGYFRTRCPRVRFFGFDSISLTSLTDRPLGRRAHYAFLGEPHPILPIEDMRLSELLPGMVIRRLVIAPLLMHEADGTPVTVVAETER